MMSLRFLLFYVVLVAAVSRISSACGELNLDAPELYDPAYLKTENCIVDQIRMLRACKGRDTQAVVMLAESIQSDGIADRSVLRCLAFALRALGKSQEALETFKAAIAADPVCNLSNHCSMDLQSSYSAYYLATLAKEAGRQEEAMAAMAEGDRRLSKESCSLSGDEADYCAGVKERMLESVGDWW